MSTPLIPQVLGKSCWAASLEMFTDRQLQQCDLLRADYIRDQPGQTPPLFCDSNWQTEDAGQFIGNTKTLDDVDDLLNAPGANPVAPPATSRPSFARLQSNIGTSAITLYSWGIGGDQHYIVLKEALEQQLTTSEVMQWIKVFDPFPVLQGRTYYLAYPEFSLAGWFKGIIYHRSVRARSATIQPAVTDRDPKKLVRKYINGLPGTMAGDFLAVTHVAPSHQILDYEFNVTNTNVSILINNRFHFFNNILALDRNIKMYLAGSGGDYSSFFLNSKSNKYHISAIENGLKYLPVLGNDLGNVIDLEAIGARTVARSIRQVEVDSLEKPDDIEKGFIKYFEKKPRTALICRFFDIGQEYVFLLRDGRVRVFDPFRSFDYIFSKGSKETTHLPLDEFLKALTQFYPILNKN
ncbi:hypothetical protein LZD49_03875 [Dyadobacter sp. CY261]|uniref:hypothetical protein n=1 Tax=Dyadobacter sp. CY261 TaxID=2907203 RepID=UPI001F21D761|nr:hypothetical protein [Dyadobacter sp. CY261]MCF0069595.1 hypothetical protein [Dyadobacter sp. CY261]